MLKFVSCENMASDLAVRFKDVSFQYDNGKIILDGASFAVRQGAKVALMGQNGAGKSTLFAIIDGTLKPQMGRVIIGDGLTIARAQQVVPREYLSLSVHDFLAQFFHGETYERDRKIAQYLRIVNLSIPTDKVVKSLSGGQQARLLLASALIQEPDILLLDEPTNNLDAEGIRHLMTFLMMYEKTVIVISHDADFLNTFTDGVLYLDVYTHTIEQYVGDYYSVVKEIKARIEKERRKNAQFEKKIRENKEKINYFANKGGKMRLLAKKLRDEVAQMEASKVDVRKEDVAIRPFTIPAQPDINGDLITIKKVHIMRDGMPVAKDVDIALRKKQHLRLIGPNGIGKTTLLESLASGHAAGETIAPGVRLGYYRQDFSTLDFDATVFDTLIEVMQERDEERMRSVAAGFLIGGKLMPQKVGVLSEGQKGLVAFAQLVLMEPGVLMLDEPTNHINFRHIPLIAQALDVYEGAMILVSHVDDFVARIRIDDELDLGKL